MAESGGNRETYRELVIKKRAHCGRALTAGKREFGRSLKTRLDPKLIEKLVSGRKLIRVLRDRRTSLGTSPFS